jgi:hypothetical protein
VRQTGAPRDKTIDREEDKMETKLDPDLEYRISELEKEENQGEGFTLGDWLFLIGSGVVFPILLLIWGW